MSLTPARLFGVVVSIGNSSIVQEILPDTESGQINTARLGPGQVLVAVPVPATALGWLTAIRNAVIAQLGSPPGSAMCAVIDKTNTVVAMIMADSAVDAAPPGVTLVNSASAFVGCTYSAGVFTPPPFTSPKASVA